MEPVTKYFVFQKGFVYEKKRLYFVTNDEEATANDVPNSQLYILINNKDWYHHAMEWDAVGITAHSHPVRTCIVLGRDGDVLVGTPSGFTEETINIKGKGPANIGPMRNIRTVGKHVFAVGMDRQVYQRFGDNQWLSYDEGLPESIPMPQVAGFNSIDGTNLKDLHVVGWEGEIWYHDEKRWNKVDSPTNLALFDVLATSKGNFYACGQEGILLQGYRDTWEVIDYQGPEGLEFRSLAWFGQKLYLADGHSLHVLEDGQLSLVNFGVNGIVPCSHLHAADGILLSVAGKEVFKTADGVSWYPIPC